jgi:hypothetical protein
MVTVRTIQQFDQVFSEEMQNPAKSVTSWGAKTQHELLILTNLTYLYWCLYQILTPLDLL